MHHPIMAYLGETPGSGCCPREGSKTASLEPFLGYFWGFPWVLPLFLALSDGNRLFGLAVTGKPWFPNGSSGQEQGLWGKPRFWQKPRVTQKGSKRVSFHIAFEGRPFWASV